MSGAVGLDRKVVHLATHLLGDRLGNRRACLVLVVHTAPRAVPPQPMVNMEVLLKVMTKRKVDERPPARRELHARREAALHDCKVADRKVAIELMHIGANLHTLRSGKVCRIDPWPGDHDHAQVRHELLGSRICADDLAEQAEPDTGPSYGDDAYTLVRSIPKLGTNPFSVSELGGSKPVT